MKPWFRVSVTAAFAVVSILLFAAVCYAPPTVVRFGLTINDPAQVWPGYVIFAARDGKVYALDTMGRPVHSWTAPPGRSITQVRPLDGGTLLVRLFDAAVPSNTVAELDSASNVVWEFAEPTDFEFHHDHSRLPNGNTLILCRRDFIDPDISPLLITDDCLLEVAPDGTIVWEWQTADHFDDFGFSPLVKTRISAGGGDWAHANAASAIPENTSHTDPRLRPGNIIVSYRFIDDVVVVDRDTGEIVWQSNALTIGQHDSQMIPDDLVGGGNLLIFDNGNGGKYGNSELTPRYWSRVVEIDPITREIVWDWDATNSGSPVWWFFSWFISGVQRLPNGNTLVDEGAFGRIFEINPSGQIVWEFVSKIKAPLQTGPLSNHVYRAYKVAEDWPGF